MESLRKLRKAHVGLTLGHQAEPVVRKVFKPVSTRNLKPSDLSKLDMVPSNPIQNQDGSFVSMMDYDGMDVAPMG